MLNKHYMQKQLIPCATKKVIITGASGLIGGKLAKRLLMDGASVYGVGRNAGELNKLGVYGDFHPVISDFEEYGELPALIGDTDFDFFLHAAWKGASTKEYNDTAAQVGNVKAACDAATAAVALRCSRLVFLSSYQQCNITIAPDDGKLNPVAYGVTKKYVSELMKCIAYKNDMAYTNIVLPNVFGPGDKPNTAIMFFLRRLLSSEPLNLISGVYPDDWIFIDDLVDGLMCALKSSGKFKEYYVGHQEITTFKDKLTEMKMILSSESELIFGTYPEAYYVDYSQMDLNALRRDTGFEPKTAFKDCILKTAEWIKTTN